MAERFALNSMHNTGLLSKKKSFSVVNVPWPTIASKLHIRSKAHKASPKAQEKRQTVTRHPTVESSPLWHGVTGESHQGS